MLLMRSFVEHGSPSPEATGATSRSSHFIGGKSPGSIPAASLPLLWSALNLWGIPLLRQRAFLPADSERTTDYPEEIIRLAKQQEAEKTTSPMNLFSPRFRAYPRVYQEQSMNMLSKGSVRAIGRFHDQ